MSGTIAEGSETPMSPPPATPTMPLSAAGFRPWAKEGKRDSHVAVLGDSNYAVERSRLSPLVNEGKRDSLLVIVMMIVCVTMPVAVALAVRHLLLVAAMHRLLEILRAVRVVVRIAHHPAVQQRIALIDTRR